MLEALDAFKIKYCVVMVKKMHKKWTTQKETGKAREEYFFDTKYIQNINKEFANSLENIIIIIEQKRLKKSPTKLAGDESISTKRLQECTIKNYLPIMAEPPIVREILVANWRGNGISNSTKFSHKIGL